MIRKYLAYGVLALLVFQTELFSAPLRLEGIISDPQDPEKSLAIIDGQPLKKGSSVDSFQITGIESAAVTLKDPATGEEKMLRLEDTQAPAPAAAALNSAPEATLNQPSPNVFQKMWEAPGLAFNRILELKALRDLAILNNAAVTYFNQRHNFPPDIKTLIDAKLLPGSYAQGIRKPYQFTLLRAVTPAAFGIHADPVDPASKLRHFYVGVDAIIRESYGKPAHGSSLPHDY